MNWAQIHLLINHVPILGSVFATLLLAYAFLRGDAPLVRLSLVLFVLLALVSVAVFFTGDPAADTLRELRVPDISRRMVHEHEEAAELATIAFGLAGVLALITLLRSRGPGRPAGWLLGLTVAAGVGVSGMMAWAGHLGGLIHHPELRSGTPVEQTAPAAPLAGS